MELGLKKQAPAAFNPAKAFSLETAFHCALLFNSCSEANDHPVTEELYLQFSSERNVFSTIPKICLKLCRQTLGTYKSSSPIPKFRFFIFFLHDAGRWQKRTLNTTTSYNSYFFFSRSYYEYNLRPFLRKYMPRTVIQ